MFGIYFTISSVPVKSRKRVRYEKGLSGRLSRLRKRLYNEQDGVCPMCGGKFEFRSMELHHILPMARFPELGIEKRNILFLCHDCHGSIHNDPFLNISLMESKARELGVQLNEVYNSKEIQKGVSHILTL